MTQNETILRHMKEHGSITALEASNEYACTRLSARIWDLKRKGEPIKAVLETGRNRFGESTTYARYYWGGR